MAEVHIQDGETLENALRRFKRSRSNVSNSNQYAAKSACVEESGAPVSGREAHVAYVATNPNTAILYQSKRYAKNSSEPARGSSARTENGVLSSDVSTAQPSLPVMPSQAQIASPAALAHGFVELI